MIKKNKKGLTTIEVIVMIVLIALILTLVIPVVNNTINKQKENLYNVQIENIKKGAKAWASANVFLLPSENGDSITITLGELKSKGFVEKDITNPKTEEKFSDNVLVVVTKKNESYLYNIEVTGNDEEYAEGAPFIVLRGKATEHVEINGIYDEKGVQARDKDGNIISSITTYIKKDGVATDIIRTNQMGTYVITYVATDLSNGKSASVSRNVVIRDTLAPTIMVNGINTNYTMIVKKDSNFVPPTAIVVDNSGETITPTVKGSVNTNKEGNYEIIYEAKDSSKNLGRLILMVVVKDIGKEIFINYKVNTSLWTNQDVTITILPVHVNNLANQPYSFDGGATWQESPNKSFSSNQVVRMKARDIEGQESETVNYTITNIDKTLPTCSITGNPTSWVTNATLTINGIDNESGVAGIKKPGASEYSAVTSTTFNVTSNGTYTAYVKDIAGNVNTCSVTVTKIDTESPTCTITGNPTEWVKNAALTITGNDSQSGVVGIQKPGASEYSTVTSTTINVTSNGAYTAYVKDGVGRIGTCSVNVTKVDNVAPTSPAITNSSNGNWTNNSITLSWVSTDDLSGIDVYQYAYSADATTWTTFIPSEQTGIVRSDERNNVLYIRAVDKAGNVSVPSSTPMKIDKTAPSCASSGGSSSWKNTNVTLTGTCSDTGGSGCVGNVSKTYSSNINSTSESPGTVSDLAGNTTTCPANQTVKIDKTAPSCASSGGSSSWKNTNVTLTGTCSDTGGSGCVGNASKTYSSNINSTSESPGTVSDNAGNSTACPANQTVKIDKSSPVISYSPNGNSTQAQSHSSTINVTDSGSSGISSLQYAWSQSNTVMPTFSTSFTNGQTITKYENVTATYYLWTKAVDGAGNTSYSVSDAFEYIQLHYIYYVAGPSGANAPATTSYTGSGTYLSSATPTPTLTGYIFTGWSTTAGGAVIYQPGDYYTGSDITLYAVYCKTEYSWTNTVKDFGYCQAGGWPGAAHDFYKNISDINPATGMFTLSGKISITSDDSRAKTHWRCFNHAKDQLEVCTGSGTVCSCPGNVVTFKKSSHTNTACTNGAGDGQRYDIRIRYPVLVPSTTCTH